MSMEIQIPEVKKILNDYEVTFESGLVISVVIDLSLGDTVTFTENLMNIHITSKPSQNDHTSKLPAEDTTIFLRHVVSIQHRKREVIELTKEQKANWQKTWQEMTVHPTVQ